MKAQIIQIGNSQGIRIPKALLEETQISGEVELEIVESGILLRNLQRPRAGWEEMFRSQAEKDDDQPLERNPATSFEARDWKW